MQRSDQSYAHVTNWTMVHSLIRACQAFDQAFSISTGVGDFVEAIQAARPLVATALAGVDEAHATAERHKGILDTFNDEKARADDENNDGACPMISENEENGRVVGIWISCCEYWEMNARDVAEAAGFVEYGTGGGCETWSKELPDGTMLWVCDDGNGIDSDPGQKCWMIGRHDRDQGGSAEINELFDLWTAIAAVEKIPNLADPTDNVCLDTLAELEAGVPFKSR